MNHDIPLKYFDIADEYATECAEPVADAERTPLALFLLQIIESGFNILGISPYLTMALWGTLLLCFIQARGMLGLDRVV